MATVSILQKNSREKLYNSVFNPDLESDLLLAYVLKKEREFLYAHPEKKLTTAQTKKFSDLMRRRKRGEPFAYIVGKAHFYGSEFNVNPNVLLPRPETEALVELALHRIKNPPLPVGTVIDVGTGSGAIIISLAGELRIWNKELGIRNRFTIHNSPFPILIATDLSPAALKVAKLNARKILGPNHKISFIKGNLLAPVLERLQIPHPWLVIANLPYLTPQESKKTELRFEPKTALRGGKNGLTLIKKLVGQFAKISKPGDNLILEIGAKQEKKIKSFTKKCMPRVKIKVFKDLSGWPRVVNIQM